MNVPQNYMLAFQSRASIATGFCQGKDIRIQHMMSRIDKSWIRDCAIQCRYA